MKELLDQKRREADLRLANIKAAEERSRVDSLVALAAIKARILNNDNSKPANKPKEK